MPFSYLGKRYEKQFESQISQDENFELRKLYFDIYFQCSDVSVIRFVVIIIYDTDKSYSNVNIWHIYKSILICMCICVRLHSYSISIWSSYIIAYFPGLWNWVAAGRSTTCSLLYVVKSNSWPCYDRFCINAPLHRHIIFRVTHVTYSFRKGNKIPLLLSIETKCSFMIIYYIIIIK